ncbi:DUF885 domain-containing protein [Tsukamurella sp. 8F]|uniref:DUF885 domain-containing protein n=1 Tax=unclassified Tsukamurella TaxID=2633480 RepID=UPI0023BA0C16|nr:MULTISPECIES: DUF885 domain-containing protein [unclassified Tsukamurella]MDF0530154.1 DUF885 domain-containing protein [Tsukamurella sp. 8J]MDF0586472.1 DUF885 domain-containing protein [Tsukamurella sp. 8F]
MAESSLTDRYLRLGLAFDRLESGFVDAYFGDPAHRRAVEEGPTPTPSGLARDARGLLSDLATDTSLPPARREFVTGHVAALEMSARKFDGEPIGFVDEVKAYFDVDVAPHDTVDYEASHAALDEVLPGPGPLRERVLAAKNSAEVPPERVPEVMDALAGALRDVVRERYPLPAAETVDFEVVSDKPWSGFNYYLGDYRSTVAVNGDLTQYLSAMPHLIAHEAYPGHHTEHCRKEQLLVHGENQPEQTIFLVNTPQCLMAEGLADHALGAAIGPGWGRWAQEIYADLGLRFDGDLHERIARASAGLLHVRQDAALMLHDRHADTEDVVAYLQRWGLMAERTARQSLRFLSSPLWRAYVSTYVEGYALLRRWLDVVPAGRERLDRFGRLLDEPLVPSSLRRELAAESSTLN